MRRKYQEFNRDTLAYSSESDGKEASISIPTSGIFPTDVLVNKLCQTKLHNIHAKKLVGAFKGIGGESICSGKISGLLKQILAPKLQRY